VAHVHDDRVVDTRLVFGSVAPVVMRCVNVENELRDRVINTDLIKSAGQILRKEIAPIDDIRSSAPYRLQVALNLLTDFLSNLGSQPKH